MAFESGTTVLSLQGMFSADPMTHLLTAVSALAVFAVLLLSRPYAQARELMKGELFTLSLFVYCGIAVVVGAAHFLAVYLGLELISLSLYAAVALRRDHAISTEAAMKYLCSVHSQAALLLYGL